MQAFDPTGGWLIFGAAVYIAFMAGRATAGRRESAEEREMRRMREQESAASTFAGLSPSVQTDVDRLLLDNKKIEAIKLIREQTGMGLKESKDLADLRQTQIKG